MAYRPFWLLVSVLSKLSRDLTTSSCMSLYSSFLQAFARAVMCNWLVCLAIWMAAASSTLPGKALAVMFPIPAFVAIGLEHAIANMFIIGAGIFNGAQVSWGAMMVNNIVPVTLGNIVGGAVCVAFAHWLAYRNKP
jgi:formate transporter